MSFTAIQKLEAALAAFDKASPAEQRTAADLAKKFATRVKVQTSGDQQTQYEACAIAAGRRLPSDIDFLKAYAEHSQYAVVRDMCRDELDSRTALFGVTRRGTMPEGSAVR